MSLSVPDLVGGIELTMAAIGAVLLWRVVLSPAARAAASPVGLAPWGISVSEFLLFILFVIGGSFFAAVAAGPIARLLNLRGDEVTVFTGAAAQLGMLAGVIACWSRMERGPPGAPRVGPNVFKAGTVTFLVALPVLIVTAKLWELVLQVFGLPTARQNLIGMFANADSPWLLATMIVLAVVLAPLTEELVFRAGIYRYLRTRVPRSLAIVGPAVLFACLHVNWPTLEGLASLGPLVALAAMFSLAYERTGQIGTAIVAHALFNLNTVVLILSGVEA